MNGSRIAKLTASAFAAGLASLMLATPAQAERAPDPLEDYDVGSAYGLLVPPLEPGWDIGQVAAGAVGGIALVGAGAAAVAGARRRHGHMAHA